MAEISSPPPWWKRPARVGTVGYVCIALTSFTVLMAAFSFGPLWSQADVVSEMSLRTLLPQLCFTSRNMKTCLYQYTQLSNVLLSQTLTLLSILRMWHLHRGHGERSIFMEKAPHWSSVYISHLWEELKTNLIVFSGFVQHRSLAFLGVM